MARRQHAEEHVNHERWLVSYADFITLLFAFFTVMYAVSTVDARKYQLLHGSITAAFNLQTLRGADDSIIFDNSSDNQNQPSVVDAPPRPLERFHRLEAALKRMVREQGLDGAVRVTLQERGLVVSLASSAFFEEGRAEIRPSARAILSRVGRMIAWQPYALRVEGHTDSRPIHNSRYLSNWELSAARATNTIQYMMATGIRPERLSLAGYGEYRPIAPNDTEAHRSRNRRVDLVILNTSAEREEPPALGNLARPQPLTATQARRAGPAGGAGATPSSIPIEGRRNDHGH